MKWLFAICEGGVLLSENAWSKKNEKDDFLTCKNVRVVVLFAHALCNASQQASDTGDSPIV